MLLALTLAATGPPILAGQRLAAPVPRWAPRLHSGSPAPATRLFPDAPDYRWEGLVVGGGFVGLLGAAVGNGFCGYDETRADKSCVWPTLEGFLIGATVGGVTGGLLGSLIPKTPRDSSQSP